MGSITAFAKRTHLTPVILACAAFCAVDLGVALPAVLKELQAKAKASGLDFFDFALLFILVMGCIGKTITSFMNRSYGRWQDKVEEQREEQQRVETELRLKAAPGPAEADGGNLR